jgi:hypothetical protein
MWRNEDLPTAFRDLSFHLGVHHQFHNIGVAKSLQYVANLFFQSKQSTPTPKQNPGFSDVLRLLPGDDGLWVSSPSPLSFGEEGEKMVETSPAFF